MTSNIANQNDHVQITNYTIEYVLKHLATYEEVFTVCVRAVDARALLQARRIHLSDSLGSHNQIPRRIRQAARL